MRMFILGLLYEIYGFESIYLRNLRERKSPPIEILLRALQIRFYFCVMLGKYIRKSTGDAFHVIVRFLHH